MSEDNPLESREQTGEESVRGCNDTAQTESSTKEAKQTPTTASESKESLVDPHRLAECFLADYESGPGTHRLQFWRDQCWEWNGRRYAILPPSDLRALITASLKRTFDADRARIRAATGEEPTFKGRVTRGLVSDVIQALEGGRHIPAAIEQPALLASHRAAYIALDNGLLDVEAMLRGDPNPLRPHTWQWFSPVYLRFAYDPAAPCPRWLDFLDAALEGDADRIALIQEWFAYCLTHDTSLQKFVVMVGEGADGKTVLVLVLIGLLGSENVSHVPLELFAERFQLTATLGKLLNAVTEIGELDKAAEGLLKAFVSGDPMYFDRKQLPGVNARPTARLLFTTNNLPHFRDRSRGLWRRMLLMPFRISVPEHRQDPHFADKLLEELPGILNWATEGLRRIRRHRRFTNPAVCREALETYRIESNPASAFLQEQVFAKPDGELVCEELRKAYRGWCADRGYAPLNDAQFGRELRRAFPTVDRKKVTHVADPGMESPRVWAYLGVAFS